MKKIILALVAVAILVGVYFIFFPIDVYVMSGNSMFPNYKDGEVLNTTTDVSVLEKGDVVLHTYKENLLVKRILAVPGESVSIVSGMLMVNGKKVENFIPGVTISPKIEPESFQQLTLGADEYFVLGDNTAASLDSRNFGPIKKSSIVLKVVR